MALNIPLTQIVGLMVLVSFHEEMHTQPCGTEYSFHSDCAPYGIGFISKTYAQKGAPYGIGFFS